MFSISARLSSDRFGKILQEKPTISTNSRDSSTSQSLHLGPALPPSKIATLSSGEFAGIIADSPDQPLPLKAFHCHMTLDPETPHEDSPLPTKKVSQDLLNSTFQHIQDDVRRLVEKRLEHMRNTPALSRLIINPKVGACRKKQAP